jgi:integrase
VLAPRVPARIRCGLPAPSLAADRLGSLGSGCAAPGSFLAKASRDRLHAAWRLSLYGLRRGEVLGLRWADIDLKAKTLTVNRSRVLVEYKVRIEEPKSRNGKRTLPLDDALVTALMALHKLQLRESAEAGTAYQAGLGVFDWHQGGEYVITDELGIPVHPERHAVANDFSDEFGRLLRRAGLRRITLHDSRHTTLTLMEHAGVPSRSSASGPGTTTPRSRRRSTSTPAPDSETVPRSHPRTRL